MKRKINFIITLDYVLSSAINWNKNSSVSTPERDVKNEREDQRDLLR